MALLLVQNLSISFANHQAVNNVSFELHRKKITALVGQSGSGKSVTALAIVNLLRKAKISGEIVFEQQNLLELSEEKLCKIRGRQIGFIFQDPNSSLNPLHKIGAQIAESITIHNPKISKKDLKKRILDLLKMVELESLSSRLNNYPHQLSGGQKQRVMIAIALANNPKILIADEPTTALDVTIQNDILNLILRLKNELEIAVLFITHNLRAVAKIADEIIEMKNGAIVKIDGKTSSAILPFISSQRSQSFSSDLQLEVKNLSVIHKAKKSFLKKENFFAIRDLNFSLNSKKNLGVIGESGSGKSTLALALLNLISAQGEIKFFNQKTWAKNNFDLRRQVQIVFQDPFSSLNPRMKVQDIIAEGLLIHKVQGDVETIMKKLNLDLNLKNRYPHQLSGGQRQRVAIARALILNPRILILDEPTSALDTATQNEILQLLAEVQNSQKISYILISHDLEVVAQIADEIMVLKAGQIVELGKKSQIISDPKNSYTKQLISNF
jgi:microcin C transport system ATP-binding protein